MKRLGIAAVATSLAASWLVPSSALAEGGYFSGQNGARVAGRAGAFAARADDVEAMIYNPAGLADMDGTTLQIANQFSYNTYDYTRAPTVDWGRPGSNPPTVTFPTVRNQQSVQPLLPLLGVASRLGLSNWTFALAAFAPPGVSREKYPDGKDVPSDGGQRYMMVEREAVILSYAASAAWRPHPIFGLGATAQWIHVPRLTYTLVIDGSPIPGDFHPVSSDFDMLATVSGSAPMTWNAIVGAWLRPTPSFQLAVSGQVLPAKIVAHSTLNVEPQRTNLGTLTIKRDGKLANDVNVTLPLPLLARAAARYRHVVAGVEVFDVELDVEYETWSRVDRFTVDANHLRVDYGSDHVFIDRIEIDKRWRDTIAVKLGGDWAVLPRKLTLRGGAFYVSSVSTLGYSNIDFPTGPRLGGALGASVHLGGGELALAYQLRYQPPYTVTESQGRVYQQVPGSACLAPYDDPDNCNPHQNGRPGPVVNAGTYQATSHQVLVEYIYRFGR